MTIEKMHKLDTLQNWKHGLCQVSDSMAAHGEIVLHEHLESIIADLDFQMEEILKGGIVMFNQSGGKNEYNAPISITQQHFKNGR